MRAYDYETCCTNIQPKDVPALNDMIRDQKAVTYRTMLKRCQGFLNWAEQHGYTVHGQDLHLKNDWHVGYYKSSFKGRPCYFVRWSAIEYIWVRRG